MNASFIFAGSGRVPTCHAATICELPDGDLLAAWYAGSREGAPDSVIMGSRGRACDRDAIRWEVPEVWVDVPDHAAGNPRVFAGPDGAAWLLAPVNYGPGWCAGGTRLFLKKSNDGGRTWSDLELLLERKGVLGKNKPLHILPGIWILPAEHERTWQITFIRSSDNGRRWRLTECPSAARLHQPSVVQLSGGELLAYMRSWEGYIFETRSDDAGETWAAPQPTILPNNNSGIDMVRLRSGRLVLACNPVALGTSGNLRLEWHAGQQRDARMSVDELRWNDAREIKRLVQGREAGDEARTQTLYPPWGPRTPLSLLVSEDEGRTWSTPLVLERGEGEYSYPSIIQDSTGAVHVVYTYDRVAIKHVRLEEGELMT